MSKLGHMRAVLAVGALFVLTACEHRSSQTPFTDSRVLETVQILSGNEMQGRQTGSEGSKKAQRFLVSAFESLNLDPLFDGYEQHFSFDQKRKNGDLLVLDGVNLVARVKGRQVESKGKRPTLVVTAHYDHMGIRAGKIYNGADDNASGVAALLAVAESFSKRPPNYDTLFVLLDAEEMGLAGAKSFVAKLPSQERYCAALNLNIDMVSRNDKNELYAAGGFHYPRLRQVLDGVAQVAPVKLLQGHDRPADGPGDWTAQSDHGVFHSAGIPFVYFGVEDHPHYHRPTDDFETLPLDFYIRAVSTIELAARKLNEELMQVGRACGV